MSRVRQLAGILAASSACGAPGQIPSRESMARSSSVEGVYEYVAPGRGQSIITGGRYVYLYGSQGGGGPMVGEAGTYEVSRDTVTNTITYSTDETRIGSRYRWTPVSWARDTVTFAIVDAQGRETARGRSVRRR